MLAVDSLLTGRVTGVTSFFFHFNTSLQSTITGAVRSRGQFSSKKGEATHTKKALKVLKVRQISERTSKEQKNNESGWLVGSAG